MLVSPLALKLTGVSPHVTILLYADDLLVIIKLPPDEVIPVLSLIFSEMSCFSAHSGLHINECKSAFLLAGDWAPHAQAQLSQFGIPI